MSLIPHADAQMQFPAAKPGVQGRVWFCEGNTIRTDQTGLKG